MHARLCSQLTLPTLASAVPTASTLPSTSITSIASVGATFWHELFSAETHAAITALSGGHFDYRFIYKFHQINSQIARESHLLG